MADFLVDLDNAKRNRLYYSGDAGQKYGVDLAGQRWMIKFPKNLRDLAKPQRSYTTSPLSEYVGSHIYELLGIPVHDTLLGVRTGKLVVACKDFRSPGDILQEFKLIKNAYVDSDDFANSSSPSPSGTSITSGSGTDIEEVLFTIRNDETLLSIGGVEERFWDMFVVDALIGNNDRNNMNWGVLVHMDGSMALAPVYDNGNSFFNKRSDESMMSRLSDASLLEQDAFGTYRSTYLYPGSNHHIDSFDFMERSGEPLLEAAVCRIAEAYSQAAADGFIDSIPASENGIEIMSVGTRTLYKTLLRMRAEKIKGIAMAAL